MEQSNILVISSTALGMLWVIFQMIRMVGEAKRNSKKRLDEDYQSSLLILNNTSKRDPLYNHIKRLCEAKRNKSMVGVASVTHKCAEYLISLKENEKYIGLFKIAHRYTVFSEENNRLEYKFGLKTKWFRRLKMYSALIFYFVSAFLALYFPMLFGSFDNFKQEIYYVIVNQHSVATFWTVAIFWIATWGGLAVLSVQYAANINFAEKLVDHNPDFHPIRWLAGRFKKKVTNQKTINN